MTEEVQVSVCHYYDLHCQCSSSCMITHMSSHVFAQRSNYFREMSSMEKIVFIVAKMTLLFFYVLAMHLLVFVTTYHWLHS